MVQKYELKIKPPIKMKLNLDTVRFSGSTYDPKYDQKRLGGQQLRVFECMKDSEWRTFKEIQDWILKHYNKYDPEVSISTRLRCFRKFEFGDHAVLRRKKGTRSRGLFEYRLVINHDWIYYRIEKGEI